MHWVGLGPGGSVQLRGMVVIRCKCTMNMVVMSGQGLLLCINGESVRPGAAAACMLLHARTHACVCVCADLKADFRPCTAAERLLYVLCFFVW
eukprot:1141479-Pelagomonas_calceolata.AAC.2